MNQRKCLFDKCENMVTSEQEYRSTLVCSKECSVKFCKQVGYEPTAESRDFERMVNDSRF